MAQFRTIHVIALALFISACRAPASPQPAETAATPNARRGASPPGGVRPVSGGGSDAVASPTHELTREVAAEVMEKKQRNEQQLAGALLAEFNSHVELLRPLQRVAASAISEIVLLSRSNDTEIARFTEKSIAGESFIPSLKVGGPWEGGITDARGLARILAHVNSMSAQQCADIMRLYGSVVDGVATMSPEYKKLQRAKDDLRAGLTSLSATQEQVWNQDDASHSYGRRRARLDPKLSGEQAWLELREHMYVSSFQRTLMEMGGGIKTVMLKNDSTVGRFERYYGLAMGADVSGTTSDTLWVLERFLGQSYDPIFNLLPVATIVTAAHHTLLEVGLAMSVSHKIMYRVGEYSTLMPDTTHPAAPSLRDLLARFEQSPDNSLLGCWYSTPRELGGCYQFAREEFVHVRNNSLFAVHRLAKRPTFPTKSELEEFFAMRPGDGEFVPSF